MKQYCYRLYTEDKDREAITNLVKACGFNSFNLTRAVGYWLNTKELSLCIEIIGDRDASTKTRLLAGALRVLNNQAAVYWVAWPIDAELIGAEDSSAEGITL